jgi:endonuclease YncB( thermonuclease family)
MTMALVKVRDTVANEELLRQGPARVFTRYSDRPICQEWQVLEAEARERSGDSGQRRMPHRHGSLGDGEDDGKSLRLSSLNLPMTWQ